MYCRVKKLSTDVSEMSDSSLMMEAVRTSETSVENYFTRQYIPEDNSKHWSFCSYQTLTSKCKLSEKPNTIIPPPTFSLKNYCFLFVYVTTFPSSSSNLLNCNNVLKMTVLWDIAQCCLVKVDRRFRVEYCLH
jgi:hypothetical protein